MLLLYPILFAGSNLCEGGLRAPHATREPAILQGTVWSTAVQPWSVSAMQQIESSLATCSFNNKQAVGRGTIGSSLSNCSCRPSQRRRCSQCNLTFSWPLIHPLSTAGDRTRDGMFPQGANSLGSWLLSDHSFIHSCSENATAPRCFFDRWEECLASTQMKRPDFQAAIRTGTLHWDEHSTVPKHLSYI